ncbi:MAG: porin family protein [Treponema sp.]|jgi:hypothetical protein|nr:porin family protein [Treponema sp.]
MVERRAAALAGLLALSLVCATGAFAQVTVSAGFALSSLSGVEMEGHTADVNGKVGVGGNLFVDYLLPISIPLSLGFEVGVDSGSIEEKSGDFEDTVIAIPLLLRAAYHFDLMPKLDLYLVGKIGYVPGIWKGDTKDALESIGVDIGTIGGVGFGFDLGVAYYFNSKLGLFGEGGFDAYLLRSKISDSTFSATLKAPFYRFLTIGVSGKF